MITSIIKKSELEGAQRIDADYYDPECLIFDQRIRSMRHKSLGDMIEVLTDYTANGSFAGLKQNVNVGDNPDFAKWIRIQNLDRNNFNENIRYVDELSYNYLKKSGLIGGELLFSKTGEHLGKAYLMPRIGERATLADNIFLIRLKNDKLNEFVVSFINSKVGRMLMLRRLQGTGQPTIIKDSLRGFLIPLPDTKTNDLIKKLFISSKICLEDSLRLYSEAQDVLLDELGIKESDFEDELSYVIDLSEATERTDAEYFQPKYLKLVDKLKTKGSKKLGELVSIKKGIEPGAEAYQDQGKLFIRVSSLSKFGIQNLDQKYLNDELYQKLRVDYEPQPGEILLTKDATPGIAYVVSQPVEGVISGGILRLKLKADIDPEYLALVINSLVGQMQAQRDAGGSVIKHWKPNQVKDIEIPLLPKVTQQKIGDLVSKSHEARKKSKDLLEQAKHQVEELIEKSKN